MYTGVSNENICVGSSVYHVTVHELSRSYLRIWIKNHFSVLTTCISWKVKNAIWICFSVFLTMTSCTRRGFYTLLPIIIWTRNVLKKPHQNLPNELLTFVLTAFSTWTAYQIKFDPKCCLEQNKNFPHVNPNIWTKSIWHVKFAPNTHFWIEAVLYEFI